MSWGCTPLKFAGLTVWKVHKWANWSQFSQEVDYSADMTLYLGCDFDPAKPYIYTEIWQKRQCAECGYAQRRKVKSK